MDLKIKGFTGILTGVVLFVHSMFFLLEAIFWMRPDVYSVLIDLLHNPVTSAYKIQALTLKNLFINQGFYNLFLVCAGVAGWWLINKGKTSAGYTLLLFVCFAATGAGIVLAFSTRAYILALLQALPAAVAFARLYPVFHDIMQHEK